MRRHLIQCFGEDKITQFPIKKPRRVGHRVKYFETIYFKEIDDWLHNACN